MYEYIGDKTAEDFICSTEKRMPVSNSQIIRQYHEEEDLERKHALLRRMERVFTEEA